jgi:hypothetical protein
MKHYLGAFLDLGLWLLILTCWAWGLCNLPGRWYERLSYWLLSLGLILLGSFYLGETVVFAATWTAR